MAQAQLRVLPSARNMVMVVDDQSTGRAILEQVIRSLDSVHPTPEAAAARIARIAEWVGAELPVGRGLSAGAGR